jgi:hypothetical protein
MVGDERAVLIAACDDGSAADRRSDARPNVTDFDGPGTDVDEGGAAVVPQPTSLADSI